MPFSPRYFIRFGRNLNEIKNTLSSDYDKCRINCGKNATNRIIKGRGRDDSGSFYRAEIDPPRTARGVIAPL